VVAGRKRIRFEFPKLAETLAPQVSLTGLRALGWSCRLRPAMREELRRLDADGAKREIAFSINFRTTDRHHQVWTRAEAGRLRSGPGELDEADAVVEFESDDVLRRFLNQGNAPNVATWVADHNVRVWGLVSCLAKFAQVAGASHLGNQPVRRHGRWPSDPPEAGELELVLRNGAPKAFGAPTGVRNLPDPALSGWTLEDFPRLQRGLRRLLEARPTISTERAVAITEAAAEEDEETPVVLARARWLAHALAGKRAIVREDEVVLGSTTEHVLGVPIYPELSHILLWPELLTLEAREPMPIAISRDDYDRLNRVVFPFWMGRNVLDVASAASGRRPLLGWICGARPLHLGEQNGLSATIPDFQTVLSQGMEALAEEARDARAMVPPEQAVFHEAVRVAIGGVLEYARRLSEQAEIEARTTDDPSRRQELMETALSCGRCPARPAETLLDALNAIRICVAALHQESMNDGLSLGRLDVLLQPYFEREMAGAKTREMKEAVVQRTVERVACMMLSLADHMPLHAESVERLRSGCRARQAITVGGVHPEGGSATCDMTYIILKAAELLALADPRVHVRYDPRATPEYLLRRACEVALLTSGGPSIHNDAATIQSLEGLGIPKPRARDWAVTATVTPTVAGEHLAFPGSATIDLVAALESALHDGSPPTPEHSEPQNSGPSTGIGSWPDLLESLTQQFETLLDIASDGGASIEVALEQAAPTPLLSSMLLGTQEAALDVTRGGARYDNPSIVVVGFADVIDSLCAVDELVFQRRSFSMQAVLSAIAEDFLGTPTLHEQLLRDAPRFGDGDERALTIAHQVTAMIHKAVRTHQSRRGGRWVAAYGGRTEHVAFGRATGALPSGRHAGAPFAPALCPSLTTGASPADRIRHAASLRSRHLAGGALFEAVVPGGALDHNAHVDRLVTHTRTFLLQGGMHVQLATVDAKGLRRADGDPATFRDQLVSVSGYDAYFVELPVELREQLVREAEWASESHAPTGRTMPPPPVEEE
jgi:pyruvate-formate lyase